MRNIRNENSTKPLKVELGKGEKERDLIRVQEGDVRNGSRTAQVIGMAASRLGSDRGNS
jgi:hypothetical protein